MSEEEAVANSHAP